MPKYRVALAYSGYVLIDGIHASDEAEAVTKAEGIVSDVPFPTGFPPKDLERWEDADVVEEVKP